MTIPAIGTIVELQIESLAYRGAGVARQDGLVYFVPETCPGETVRAGVTKHGKRFVEAEVESILVASAARIAPCCRVADAEGTLQRVPGCVYDHLTYQAEVEAKQSQYLDFLSRQAGLENAAALLAIPFPSPKELQYRNKIVLHSGDTGSGRGLGYKLPGSGRILDMPACPLASQEINRTLEKLRDSRRLDALLEKETDVTLRWTQTDGTVMWAGKAVPGARMLSEETAIGILEVPPDGFAQVNPAVSQALTEEIMQLLRREKPRQLVDLYCGSGIFALAAAKSGVAQVIGIETNRRSVHSADSNARKLGLSADFLCCPASEGLRKVERGFESQTGAMILDPPRQGLDSATLQALLDLRPALLIYISCAPDMLARDLKRLTGEGSYELVSGALFDMFPRTAHFETLNILKIAT